MAGAIAGALIAGVIARATQAQPAILYLVFGTCCGSSLGGRLAR